MIMIGKDEHIPLVYIIVLNWNGKNDTIECLRSLRGMTYPNARVLVVDNGSTDDSVDSIAQLFPDITILRNEKNLRFAGGNNKGIEHALTKKADAILLLNNDTIVENNFLTAMIDELLSNEQNGMVGPKILYFAAPKKIWFAGGIIKWHQGWMMHRGIREDDHGQYDYPTSTDYISGCCLLVKREVVEKIGMLDESYFIYGEDADWCERAKREGFLLRYAPKAIIWHKVSASSGGNLSLYKNWNKLKSNFRFFCRYARWYYWITIPFGMIWKMIISFVKIIFIHIKNAIRNSKFKIQN